MKIHSLSKYLLAYLLWVILLALGFLFNTLAQNAFEAFLGMLTSQNNRFLFVRQMIVLDRVFAVLIWLVWLVMMIVSEESFRQGAKAGGLLKRFFRFAGPLLLGIFVADLYLLSVAGFSAAPWLRWVLLALELTLGAGFTWYGRPYGRARNKIRVHE
mgnify:CR=1 FL=1